jgi:hypothetical protein
MPIWCGLYAFYVLTYAYLAWVGFPRRFLFRNVNES